MVIQYLNSEDLKKEIQNLEKELNNPETLKDKERLKELSQKYKELKEKKSLTDSLEKIEKKIREAKDLYQETEEKDREMAKLAEEELKSLQEKKKKIEEEIKNVSSQKIRTDRNVIVEIRAGTGGEEASLFAADLFKMYSRFAEKNNWQVQVIDSSPTSLHGFKEIVFSIKGKDAFQKLRFESGVHRVQRIPVTEKSGRIHTSTASVAILPEASEVEVKIKPEDLEVSTFRSSGHGGQNVQKVSSAVRILHKPTGLVVTCQEERSQQRNKEKALKLLRARLLAHKIEKQEEELGESRRSQIGKAMRAEKIRTYNFPQNRVTDHRLNKSWYNLEEIMDGNLEEIINEENH